MAQAQASSYIPFVLNAEQAQVVKNYVVSTCEFVRITTKKFISLLIDVHIRLKVDQTDLRHF